MVDGADVFNVEFNIQTTGGNALARSASLAAIALKLIDRVSAIA